MASRRRVITQPIVPVAAVPVEPVAAKVEKTDAEIMADITRLFGTQCYYYTHTTCIHFAKTIKHYCDAGVVFTEDFLAAYLRRIITHYSTYQYRNHYHNYDCITGNEHKQVLGILLQYIPIKEDIISIVANIYDNELIQLICNNNKQHHVKLFESAIYCKNVKLVKYMIDNNLVEITVNQLNSIITCLPNNNSEIEHIVIDILNKKIMPNETTVLNALVQNYAKSTIQLMFTLGVQLNTNILIQACGTLNREIIIFILENKIKPDKQCFNKLVESSSKLNPKYYTRNRRYYEADYNKHKNIPELIDVLVAYGYVVTYEDILYALKYFIAVNNIERFNIEFDEKYTEECSKHGFYPYKNKVKYNQQSLENECIRDGNLEQIKTIIKSGVTPTTKCVINLCKHKNNVQALKYVIDNGAKVDINCIKTFADTIGNKTLLLLIEKFIEHSNSGNKTEETLDDKIKKDKLAENADIGKKDDELDELEDDKDELEDDKDELEDDKDELEQELEAEDELEQELEAEDELEEQKVKRVTGIRVKESTKKLVKKAKAKKKSDDLDLTLDTDDEFDIKKSKVVVIKGNTKKVKEKAERVAKGEKAKKEDKTKNAEKTPAETKKEETPEPEFIIVKAVGPIDLRKKYTLNKNFKTFFKLKDNSEMTFIEIRKKFLEYINKNNLSADTYINIDNNIATTFNINTGKLQIDNIDAFLTNNIS